MNDPISTLEQELMELTPTATSEEFIQHIEEGLGSQANIVDMNQPVNPPNKVISFPSIPWSIAAAIILLLGVVSSSIYFQEKKSEQLAKTKVQQNTPQPTGVSSSSNTNDWQPTDRETILVDVTNEGIIQSGENTPSQQFRYKYMDMTTYTDPVDHSQMQMAVPREHVVQVKLEPY